MCLILIVWRSHPAYRCIVAANRDELHARPSEPAHWWPDAPSILAGRDQAAGGTWLGVTRGGRFAALTNFRDSSAKRSDKTSRGLLVSGFLSSNASVAEELSRLSRVGGDFNGFNLLLSDGQDLGIYESVSGAGRVLPAGMFGLSNHLLDTPWPKVVKAKARMCAALAGTVEPSAVLEFLRDDRPAPDAELPRTGVSEDWERLLSSAFVRGTEYGTRCSTLVRSDTDGNVSFDEWSWDAAGSPAGMASFGFHITR